MIWCLPVSFTQPALFLTCVFAHAVPSIWNSLFPISSVFLAISHSFRSATNDICPVKPSPVLLVRRRHSVFGIPLSLANHQPHSNFHVIVMSCLCNSFPTARPHAPLGGNEHVFSSPNAWHPAQRWYTTGLVNTGWGNEEVSTISPYFKRSGFIPNI